MSKYFSWPVRCAAGVLIGLFALTAQAAMYKWVDEDGLTHYTQQPPPDGIEGETLEGPPDVNTENARQELKQDQKRLKQLEKSRQEEEAQQKKREQRAALYEKNCRLARERLNNLRTTGRVRAVDEEGNVRRLPVEEHEARIASVEEKVSKYCNGN